MKNNFKASDKVLILIDKQPWIEIEHSLIIYKWYLNKLVNIIYFQHIYNENKLYINIFHLHKGYSKILKYTTCPNNHLLLYINSTYLVFVKIRNSIKLWNEIP